MTERNDGAHTAIGSGSSAADSRPTADTSDAQGNLLALGVLVADVDLSRHSQVRQTLRWRLLEEHPTNRSGSVTHPGTGDRRRGIRPRWAVAVAGMLAVLMCVGARFGALTPAAQGFEAIVRSLMVGEHSVIQLLSPATVKPTPSEGTGTAPTRAPTAGAGLVTELREGYWLIESGIGVFTIPATLPGREATLRRYMNLDEVRSALPYDLRTPGYLPGDLIFREAILTPVQGVFLLYGGSTGDLIILQMPVGEQPHAGSQAPMFAGVEMLTDGPIEPVTIDGLAGAWVGSRVLIWESQRMNYMLGGAGLSREDALRIAESLE
jgi:hypothetical protein